jgi:hypothetical protein
VTEYVNVIVKDTLERVVADERDAALAAALATVKPIETKK